MVEPQAGPIVQIATYNTNLQGNKGLPQDLVDWLSPALHVSQFLSHSEKQAPDLIAVGFQELLPLHLGLSGLSKSVLENRDALIRSQIEKHAPKKERYSLVAKIVNVGVALLVYACDDTLATRVCEVQTQWTGCGPGWMGNKGAVGVRFRLKEEGDGDGPGETYTFVCAHLTAHQPKLKQRIADYNHIVASLLFPPPSPSSSSAGPTNIYATSHLFIFGDLNFRLSFPAGAHLANNIVHAKLENEDGRLALRECDQLYFERRRGRVFVGLREGNFWDFKCTYKYQLGTVDHYSAKRTPAWTDRIMYTTYTDSEDTPEQSTIKNLSYSSVPSYTTSDHKPVVALLQVPSPAGNGIAVSNGRPTSHSSSPPLLRLPSHFTPPAPDAHAALKRLIGRSLDRAVGYLWCLLWLIGAGNAGIGLGNVVVGLGVCAWWWSKRQAAGW